MNLYFGVEGVPLNTAETFRGEVRDKFFERIESAADDGRRGRDRQLEGLMRR